MCVHVYSPGKTIQLDYVVEQIFLKRRGTAEILLDVLITNKSEEVIDKVFILFPHRMYKISIKNKSDIVRSSTGKCEDITESYLDHNSIFNTIYKLPGSEIIHSADENKMSLNIKIPNPSNPVDELIYEGEIVGVSELQNYDFKESMHEKILNDLNLSILINEFKTPLLKNRPRWVRWRITADQFSKDQLTGFQFVIRSLFDEIKLRYDIIGPFDVKARFIKKIGCFQKICSYDENPKRKKIAMFVSQLMQEISKPGFDNDNTVTLYPDWRITLFSNKFELDNIFKEGDIQVSGTSPSPNYIENDLIYSKRKRRKHYYRGDTFFQWKSGERNIGIQNYNGEFSIGFVAKHISTFKRLLPMIALLVSLLGITLTIIRFILDH
jgi:hypothetical protein